MFLTAYGKAEPFRTRRRQSRHSNNREVIMARKFLKVALILSFAISAAFGQQSSGTPSVSRLQQIISYLASDALEGRRSGTAGANDAAHYIAGEFSLLGLRPGMQMARPGRTRGEIRARYLQPFPYVAEVTLGKENLFAISNNPAILKVGEDWMPLGFSSNAIIKDAPVIFAGYGISSAALKYDDYAVADAKDRVALVFEGTPDRDNPHGQFVQAGQVRFKAAAARAAGARALVIISDQETLKDDRLSRPSYDNAGEAGIAVIVISRTLGAKLLRMTDTATLSRAQSEMSAWVLGGGPTANCKTPCGVSKNFSLPIAERLNLGVDVVRRESPSFNVIGILPGSDPKLKDEAIVIGAHYDHLGRGGEGSLAPREGDIHHGADDNASGVAGLLELARLFSTQNPKPRRTIVFIAFSGEEEGLIGSNYYVNHPVVPLANTVAMINMDMIGRLREKKLIVGGVGTAQEWRATLNGRNVSFGGFVYGYSPASGRLDPPMDPKNPPGKVTMFDFSLNEDGYGPSDHSSFYAKQIPVLFFWTGNHEDYHKPSDTAAKINYEGEARIISFVANVVHDIDKSDKRPTYTVAKSESQGRALGFRVYLGTIPNYADTNDGLKLDGVRDDSPAAKAGLRAGDKIVKMAGREVKNVYDYTYALGEMKAGQEYEVELIRDGKLLTLKITPEARK
jgi:aminopeptidase YwaD